MQTVKTGSETRTDSAAKRIFMGAVFLMICFCLPAAVPAQVGAVTDGWQRVQSLPDHAIIHVKADSGTARCLLDRVDGASLTCSSRHLPREFSRSEIKEIKLLRRGRSAAKDAAIGLGVGAAVGAVAIVGLNGSDTGSMLHTSMAKASGAGAAIGGTGGILAGAVVGYSRGFSAGTVVYRRP